MFNWFKSQQPHTEPQHTPVLTDEAQAIIYSFADHVAKHPSFIGDASTLPYPKETIRHAFTEHIKHYEVMRGISSEAFRNMGYNDTVEQLQAMAVRLDDWHHIDPQDKDAVTRINQIQGPPPEWAMPLFAKYFGRAARK